MTSPEAFLAATQGFISMPGLYVSSIQFHGVDVWVRMNSSTDKGLTLVELVLIDKAWDGNFVHDRPESIRRIEVARVEDARSPVWPVAEEGIGEWVGQLLEDQPAVVSS